MNSHIPDRLNFWVWSIGICLSNKTPLWILYNWSLKTTALSFPPLTVLAPAYPLEVPSLVLAVSRRRQCLRDGRWLWARVDFCLFGLDFPPLPVPALRFSSRGTAHLLLFIHMTRQDPKSSHILWACDPDLASQHIPSLWLLCDWRSGGHKTVRPMRPQLRLLLEQFKDNSFYLLIFLQELLATRRMEGFGG